MRFVGWWVLCAALQATGAAAQPAIVDPTPDDDETDWQLLLEDVDLDTTLDTPTGLVFIGTRANEELLVLEKNTGRVRHFRDRAELPVALDLGVDNCGERGLISIARHPNFDRTTSGTLDPEDPSKDWIYLSYHSDDAPGAGSSGDGCSNDDTQFRVVRYVWDGTQLTPATPTAEVFSKTLTGTETAQVGGAIGFTFEFDADEDAFLGARLYIAIGSLGHVDGLLQNKKDGGLPLDDTSVVLRLQDDGSRPGDNPFETDPDVDTIEDRYFCYGLRDPRALLVEGFVDPTFTRAWISERNDGGNDELDGFSYGGNGGFTPYDGIVTNVPDNIEDDEPNPLYPLVDLGKDQRDDPVSTYQNPAFVFEAADVHPTGLAIGGVEVGPQHEGDLFVGLEDGRLLRYHMDGGRDGFLLGVPLADKIANLGAAEDNPDTEPDETLPDDLTQILIATGFGVISDLETFIDGSLYVVDQTNGTLHHIFYDAVRDLSVVSVKAPKKISLSAKKPTVTKAIRVTIANPGEVAERIETTTPEQLQQDLTDLLGLEAHSPSCPDPTVAVLVPKYAQPPYDAVIGVAPDGGRLSLDVNVVWACPGLASGATAEFTTSVSVDMEKIGIDELPENQANNVCPRPPAGDDPGCGAKTATGALGGPIVTRVTQK